MSTTDDVVPDATTTGSCTSCHEHIYDKASLSTIPSRLDLHAEQRLCVSDVASPAPRRRGFSRVRHQSVPATMSVGKSTRRKRKVTFKNMYAPEVVPPPKVESYDELVFNVAGLFHTVSFLHDPDDWGDDDDDDDPIREESQGSSDAYYDPEPPLERSIPLMIAEFLYRSAMFLGHPQGETPWLPGFRQDKKFSSNDVKRWRRLAHFDWETEEREFLTHHAAPRLARTQSMESNGHTSVMSAIGASFRMQQHHQDSGESDGSSQSLESSSGTGTLKLRSAVTRWLRKHKGQQQHHDSNEAADQGTTAENADEKHRHGKHKPVSWLNPPPISSSRSLQLLVDIINSCVYCGHVQFRKRDIVRLCNVKI